MVTIFEAIGGVIGFSVWPKRGRQRRRPKAKNALPPAAHSSQSDENGDV